MSREGEWLLICSPALERLESRFRFADQVEECTPRDCCRLLSKAVVGSKGKKGMGEESGIQVLPRSTEKVGERGGEKERESSTPAGISIAVIETETEAAWMTRMTDLAA